VVVEAGEVNSNRMHKPVSRMCPSADDYAKMVVNSLGCGKQIVNPHLEHALIYGGLAAHLPEGILAPMLQAEMKKIAEICMKWK
jgi:hypothetical protein